MVSKWLWQRKNSIFFLKCKMSKVKWIIFSLPWNLCYIDVDYVVGRSKSSPAHWPKLDWHEVDRVWLHGLMDFSWCNQFPWLFSWPFILKFWSTTSPDLNPKCVLLHINVTMTDSEVFQIKALNHIRTFNGCLLAQYLCLLNFH